MGPDPEAPGRRGGCCKWGGIACLGCGCASALVLIVVSLVLMQRPEVQSALGRTQQVVGTLQRMQQVAEALGKYVQDHRQYPPRLDDLAPRYISERMLRVSEKAGAPQFEYHPPPKGAGNDFVILAYEVDNPVMPERGDRLRYVFTKGGKFRAVPLTARETQKPPSGPGEDRGADAR